MNCYYVKLRDHPGPPSMPSPPADLPLSTRYAPQTKYHIVRD
eukprot:COSAG03_NODE_2247_length_2960_cov_1.153792_5_plen_41_part_01